MTAVTERAIHGEIARFRTKHSEDLIGHNRSMGPRGRLAACQDLGDIVAITLRSMLFVFFGEMLRVRASISRSSLVLCGIRHLCCATIFSSMQGFTHTLAPRANDSCVHMRKADSTRCPVLCCRSSLCKTLYIFLSAVETVPDAWETSYEVD